MQRQLCTVPSPLHVPPVSLAAILLLVWLCGAGFAKAPLSQTALLSQKHGEGGHSYFGFDKDDYPGDDLLPALRRSFAYTGYWLNRPPGAAGSPAGSSAASPPVSSWAGKRSLLKARGFGFLILFNGRLDAELKQAELKHAELKNKNAAALGRADALAAISAAKREGFPAGAIVFLDQEEGGRLLSEQKAYLFAWVEAVRKSPYRPGVYCSGIQVPDGSNGSNGSGTISTAEDILSHESGPIALWEFNDQCPPSPGCVLPQKPPFSPAAGLSHALVWQYAQSPRSQFARQCKVGYAADGNCYAPGLPHNARSFLDLDLSSSADPSLGR